LILHRNARKIIITKLPSSAKSFCVVFLQVGFFRSRRLTSIGEKGTRENFSLCSLGLAPVRCVERASISTTTSSRQSAANAPISFSHTKHFKRIHVYRMYIHIYQNTCISIHLSTICRSIEIHLPQLSCLSSEPG